MSYIDELQIEINNTDFTPLRRAAGLMIYTLEKGGTIYIIGNGGSAADAEHFAAELVGRFETDRPAIPAVALTNPAIITAIGNDYGFDEVFSRQLEAAKSVDILWAISTSGMSTNILKAIETARRKCMLVISFGNMDGNVRFVPKARRTSHIQELYLMAGHMVCSAIEQARKEVR